MQSETLYLSILELQNRQSQRKPSYTMEFKSLTAAKRSATRNQMFQGTTLVIEDAETGVSICMKSPDGAWSYDDLSGSNHERCDASDHAATCGACA